MRENSFNSDSEDAENSERLIVEPAPSDASEDGIVYKIEYSHFVEETPVGVMFGFFNDALVWSGGWFFLILIVTAFIACQYPRLLLAVLGLTGMLVGAVWTVAYVLSQKHTIRASAAGIEFPSIFIITLGGDCLRSWDDLVSVRFLRDDSPSFEPTEVKLKFSDRGEVCLRMDGMSKVDLERFMLILDTYCPNVLMVPSPDQLGLSVHKEHSGNSVSFTGLWYEELNSRFGSTAFVPLESGDRLQEGALEIVGQVAFGGLSAVYLGKTRDSTVIVKEMVMPDSSDEAARAKALELFQRESRMLAKIEHPRIARIFDYFVEGGRHYQLLEYLDGKNVCSYVEEYGPQAEYTVLVWALQVSEILEYLHGLSPPVVHRDLTPANLIVGRSGEISLIDFGAANDFLGTATGTVIGKNAYIPLEQFRGKAVPASDIYAFGGTLFFLLTGKDPEPFNRNDVWDRNTGVLEGTRQLILDCMEMDWRERIADSSSLTVRIKALLASSKHDQSNDLVSLPLRDIR